MSSAVVGLQPAVADSAPPSGTPATVTADPLPTVQIDGVVWTQEVVGDTVYVGGEFKNARPAGAAPGVSTTSRTNVLAYSLSTGELVTSWAPQANAQVLTIAKSPNGQRIYVGGSFTSIAGQSRFRIAAFDTATGQLVSTFTPSFDGSVNAIVATDTTVYVGGAFTTANGTARYRVAAFSASNGALLPWRPVLTDGIVRGLELSPDRTKVLLGGSFTSVNGSSNPGYGLALVRPDTGASLPLPANSLIRNAGTNASVWGLDGDAENFYVAAYTFYGGGSLEGVAAIRWNDGNLAWIKDCHGDTYSVYSTGDVVYSASHSHYCANIGSFPQTDPQDSWTYYRATAVTQDATLLVGKEATNYFNYDGKPGPTVLNWFPELNAGSYTGQTQGPWQVSGSGPYVLMGGEFTKVNGTNQQGIVRFATSDVAPNKVGPRFTGAQLPITGRAIATGAVRLSWQANADYDNEALTYRVIRDGELTNPAWQSVYRTQIWRRPYMGFTDTGLAPGSSHTYRVMVTDPFGNQATSETITVVANGSGTLGAYASRVLLDGASYYWRLGESAGPTIRDWASTNDGTAGAGVGYGLAGALTNDANTAGDLSPQLSSRVLTPTHTIASNYFTVEAWVRANTSERGRIVGYGNATDVTKTSTLRDRMLWIDGSGRFNFGVNAKETRVLTSPNRYDNSAWHHVAVTMGSGGLAMFVDGVKVAAQPTWTTAQNFVGGWSIGSDSLSGWPNRPTTDYFGGRVDEVAIYPDALPAATVLQHFQIGKALINVAPTASFGTSTNGLGLAVDGTASTDLDGSITSYAWAFGDGGTATGPTASHTYAAAGTYTVTLTVKDDKGATGTATRQVTAVALTDEVAVDTFSRTLGNGWADADHGGTWTLSGAASTFAVGDGVGRMTVTSAGAGRSATLAAVSTLDVDAQVSASLDRATTGAGNDLILVGRVTGTGNEYRAQAKVLSTGVVQLALRRFVGGTATSLAQVDVPGVTYAPGMRLRIRMQAAGSSPTTLRAKVWPDGQAEPGGWQLQTTDATAALQAPGGVGLATYVSASATDAPVTASFDDFTAGGLRSVPNVAPTASFTSATTGLGVAVDGSASTDPDGSIASYAWAFGDGATGSGATASHTYAAAGTYTVTLTVTDNTGATDTETGSVTVTPPSTSFALDAFGRTVANGWGSADLGGAWTLSGTAANFSVSGGVGRMIVPAAGNTRSAVLGGLSQSSVDAQVSASLDKAPTGAGTDLVLIGRRINATNDYRVQAKVAATGAVSLSIRRVVSGTNTALATVTVPGLTYTAGDQLRIRFQVDGTGTTTLRTRVWLVGQSEPATWQLQTTDTTAALQAAGGVGVLAYLSGSTTNAPVTASFDDLSVDPIG